MNILKIRGKQKQQVFRKGFTVSIKRLLCLIIGITMVLSATTIFGAENIDKHLTAANIAKLEKGETILLDQTYKDKNGKTRGKGLAIIQVNASKDKACKHLSDFTYYKGFMPMVIVSDIYHNGEGKVGVGYVLKVVIKKVKYHCMHSFDKGKGEIKFWLDDNQKNDIKSTEGLWKVIPRGDKCFIAYTVSVDTGVAIPKAIQDYLTKKDLPNVVKAAKMRIESGGTYTK